MRLSFWPEGHRPSALQLAMAIAKMAAVGALIGCAGTLLSRLGNVGSRELALSALCGAIYAVAFYVCCALPWVYLGPVVFRFPASFKHAVTAMVGAVGSCAALTISIVLTDRLPGVRSEWSGHLGSVLWGEAAAGAVIALVIGAFRRLQMAVTKAEAQIHEREMRETQLSEAAAKAQAAALQSQINPHFFFNTLNTLASLIPADAKDAQEIVGRLADMFRYTLACSRAEAVTLNQELEFTENYLRLEQARFGARLRLRLPQGEFSDISLPGLSLQPLVENAIKYGVARRVEGGEVEVAVRRNGTTFAIDVKSPLGENGDARPFFRAGHALENVRDRLKLFAGERAGVDVAEEREDRVRVSLVLPQ